MNTGERLLSYYQFSEPVVDAVVDVAERQASFDTYPNFLVSVGINDFAPNGGIIDIKPKDFDSDKALVVHTSMANPIDPNNLYSLATLAALYPNRRIVATGNPSGIGFGHNILNRTERKLVSEGDFTPAVSVIGKYLEEEKVSEVVQIGVSYGADLALATKKLDIFDVPEVVAIEPASVISRSIINLAKAFKSSEPALNEYVNASGLESFLQARKDSVSSNNYALGLLRLTNIAVARGIAKGRFEENLDTYLRDGDSSVNVIWGTDSELCIDAVAIGIVHKMQRNHGFASVSQMRLPGQKHAMTNDLHLYAAIVAESIGLS